MNFKDNKVISIFQYALSVLNSRYDENESKNITTLLFESYFGYNRADIILKANDLLSESEILQIHKAVKKLREGVPVQYLLGECEFYGLPFIVGPEVLIPRPETEELVEWIIAENEAVITPQIIDIGTGSGCISIALAKKLNTEIFACDISDKALELAKLNAEKNKVVVNFSNYDILNSFPPLKEMDVIVSNPPYIPIKERGSMDLNVVDYEPSIALFVEDEDPIVFYRTIAEFALESLKIGGKLYFEMHYQYSKQIAEMLFDMEFNKIEIKKDISGHDRMIRVVK